MIIRYSLLIIALFSSCNLRAADLPVFHETPPAERIPGQVYIDKGGQEIYWPKAQVSSEDVYSGVLRKYKNYRRGYTDADYVKNGFDASRLGTLPPAGEHPRLYITPDDLARIRENVAKGDEAPHYFQIFWNVFKHQAGVDEAGEIPADKIAAVTGTGYSMINPFLRQILYAQIVNDDELGRELAKRFAAQAKEDIEVIKLYDEQVFRDNMWVVSDTRWLPDGHPMKNRGQWYWPMYPEAYDYAWRWMDDKERADVRAVMAAIIADRYTHFMEIASNHHLINHASMAMLFASYFLAIEGEEGFDAEQYAVVREKYDEVLEYYIAPSGIMYENVKGFLPWQIYLAMARREEGKPLMHPHVFEHMRQTVFSARNVQNSYAIWTRPPLRVDPEKNEFAKSFWDPRGDWRSRTWEVQPSGHALPFLTMMHYFYSDRKDFDLIFKSAVHTANLNFFMDMSLNTTVRDLEFPALMLAFASDGVVGADGEPVNWNEAEVDFMDQTSHIDMERGLGQMRSSWKKDALQLNIDGRSDFYTGGHESPDLGNFNFAAHGIHWAPYFGAYQPAVHRNVITVDGMNGQMPSVSGDFISQTDSETATTAVIEYSRGMQFNQQSRNELIQHPKLTIPFHQWMAGSYGWGKTRSQQAAFAPSSRWFEEYQTSIDFGQWGSQNTGGAFYERLLPEVDYAWRTLQMVKGERPFILIVDDVKLDDQIHDFRFNLNLNPDIIILDQPMADEMVLGRSDMEKRHQGVRRPLDWQIPAGEPLLFVKVLNRNTESEYPRAGYEMTDNIAMVTIPARTVSPSFKTLIYPYRKGDPTPSIAWNEDKTRLAITIGDDSYEYEFGIANNGRTVFTMHKNGDLAEVVGDLPQHPVFAGMPPVHQGSRYSREGPDLGPPPQPRDPAPTPSSVFTDSAELRFDSSGPGQEIRYTTDGSEPIATSTLYTGPTKIPNSTTVMAATFARYWPWADEPVSEVSEAQFIQQTPIESEQPEQMANGLICEVYEIFRPEWDTDGYVNPGIDYLPDVTKYTPILTASTAGFELPPVRGQQPIEEVYKGYYRFRGFIEATTAGIYTFQILSNGPIRFVVGGETVIEESGYYHQDNKTRYGQLALAPGKHAVELIVCDPVFWKKEREGEMPFSVQVAIDGSDPQEIPTFSPGVVLASHAANPFAATDEEIPLLEATNPETKLARGLLRSTYARTSLVSGPGWLFSKKAGPAGIFDVDGEQSIAIDVADEQIDGSDYDGQMYEYSGWYKAPYDGVYQFELDPNGNNQLAIGGRVIAQNNVPGDQVGGTARLEAGYHAIALKLARSGGRLDVQTPADSEPVKLLFGDLFRPETPELVTDPENFLVLGLPEQAYANEEQTVETPMGDYRLRVEGARVVDDPAMGKVLEFLGDGSGLRLYDWPSVGRYLTVSFWVKIPPDSRSLEYLQIGREGATGHIDSRSVRLGFPRFYATGNNLRICEIEQGNWVHLTLQWGPWTRIYVNGEMKSKVYAAGDPTMQSRPHNLNARSDQMQLFVGRDGSFKGHIAGLRIYNALLSDDYVKQLYDKSQKPKN